MNPAFLIKSVRNLKNAVAININRRAEESSFPRVFLL